MKLSTIYWFGMFFARHPVMAIDILSSFYFERESVKTARHPLGEDMFVLLPDLDSIILYMGKTLEPDVIAFMKSALEPGMTVFDIGANMGYHTIGARELVTETGRVVAFEPIPYLRQILSANIERYDNVSLEEMAITEGKEPEILIQFYGIKYSGFSTTTEPRANRKYRRRLPNPEELSVPAISIDDYVAKSGNIPDLMKIDIENGEMNALRGGAETISQYTPQIIMEGEDISRTEENSTRACLEFLKKFGYNFFEFDAKKSRVVKHELNEVYPDGCNILCVPISRI